MLQSITKINKLHIFPVHRINVTILTSPPPRERPKSSQRDVRDWTVNLHKTISEKLGEKVPFPDAV